MTALPPNQLEPLKSFVYWTGMVSLLSGVAFQFPAMMSLLLPSEQPGLMMHLFGLVAMFLGVMLMFSSRDLLHRAPLVAWEGVLRLGGFVLFAGYGICGGAGVWATMAGSFDLAIGVIYLAWLPRHFGVGLTDLLRDQGLETR